MRFLDLLYNPHRAVRQIAAGARPVSFDVGETRHGYLDSDGQLCLHPPDYVPPPSEVAGTVTITGVDHMTGTITFTGKP